MATLAEIRAKLQAQENRSAGNNTQRGDRVVYPHWDIPENSNARFRFLPDANKNNDFFWAERLMINSSFAGIKGQPDSKPVTVQVPCIDMWEPNSCPILAEVRPWYKDKSLEELANKYWKKRSYLFQGFVRENPLADDQAPENPIRRFVISPQIFKTIKAALLDPELDNMPTDYVGGLDFTVTKTTKGNYADYSTSKWSRRESALTAEEAEAIEKYGLFNLADFLPKRPTDVEIKVMKEMFEASVDGQPYDTDRWGAYFRPRGVSAPTTNTTTNTTTESADRVVATEHVDSDEELPWVADTPKTSVTEGAAPAPTAPIATPTSSGTKQNAEDILAMIRNRQKNS